MTKQTTEIKPQSAQDDGKRLWSMISATLKQTQKPVLVTIEEGVETRKIRQNRLLWKWNQEIADHIFHTQGSVFGSEDVHEFLVRKLLPVRVVQIKGETVTVRSETKNLTVKQFSDYLNKLEYYAIEHLGATLTHPDDLYWDALMKQPQGENQGGGM